MDKIHSVSLKGDSIQSMVILPYNFLAEQNFHLTYNKPTPESFRNLLQTIPEESETVFTVVTDTTVWWGKGKKEILGVYKTLDNNPYLLHLNGGCSYADFVTAQEQNTERKSERYPKLPQRIVIGVAYTQPKTNKSTIAVGTFSSDPNSPHGQGVKYHTLYVFNPPESLSTSQNNLFGGSSLSSLNETFVDNPIDRYVENQSIPITTEFAYSSTPIFTVGETDSDYTTLYYQSELVGSTEVILYDCGVGPEHIVAREI